MKTGRLFWFTCCVIMLAAGACTASTTGDQPQLELTLPALQSRLNAMDIQLHSLATAIVAEQRLATVGFPEELFITPTLTPAKPFTTALPEDLPGEAGPTAAPQEQQSVEITPEAAAAAAVEAFYTVNYLEGFEAWAVKLCDLSTIDGCRDLRTLTGWNQWNLVYRVQRWQTECQAVQVERVQKGQSGGAAWRVSYTINGTCTGCSLPQSGEVTVSLAVDGTGNLKLDAFNPGDDLGGNKIPLPITP